MIQALIIVTKLTLCVYRSTVEGYARFSPANSKWTKHTVAEHVSLGGNGPLFVGTPSQVADSLETWVREADVDGFNFVSGISSCRPTRSKPLMQLYRDMCCSPSHSRISLSCLCQNFGNEGSSGTTTLFPAAPTVKTFTRKQDELIRLRTILQPSIIGPPVLLPKTMSSLSKWHWRAQRIWVHKYPISSSNIESEVGNFILAAFNLKYFLGDSNCERYYIVRAT